MALRIGRIPNQDLIAIPILGQQQNKAYNIRKKIHVHLTSVVKKNKKTDGIIGPEF